MLVAVSLAAAGAAAQSTTSNATTTVAIGQYSSLADRFPALPAEPLEALPPPGDDEPPGTHYIIGVAAGYRPDRLCAFVRSWHEFTRRSKLVLIVGPGEQETMEKAFPGVMVLALKTWDYYIVDIRFVGAGFGSARSGVRCSRLSVACVLSVVGRHEARRCNESQHVRRVHASDVCRCGLVWAATDIVLATLVSPPGSVASSADQHTVSPVQHWPTYRISSQALTSIPYLPPTPRAACGALRRTLSSWRAVRTLLGASC